MPRYVGTCKIMYEKIRETIHKSGLYDLTPMAYSQPPIGPLELVLMSSIYLERGGNFLLSPASAPGEVLISIFDWTVSVMRNDFLVSSEPYVGILI